MKSSSAAQSEYPDSTTTIESNQGPSSGVIGETVSAPDYRGSIDSGSNATVSLKATVSDDLRSVYAITAKLAGRLNAAKISEEEHRSYLEDRQKLLDKRFSGEITREELNRLAYVRWTLDRIEDAKHGEKLDALRMAAAQYEEFANRISLLEEELERAVADEQERQRTKERGRFRR
jgi:hypothetical protein